jgi:hypothetical protein
MSEFVGRVFRRHTSLNVALILNYLIFRLQQGYLYDLVVLREIISNMSSVKLSTDLSENQLKGLSGGSILHDLPLDIIHSERQSFLTKLSAQRLLEALMGESSAQMILVCLAQLQQTIVYSNCSTALPIKLLSNLCDDVSLFFMGLIYS